MPASCSKSTVEAAGQSVEVPAGWVKIEEKTTKTNIREFTPNVIEPSFGIGRILYSILEHAFWSREADSARNVSLLQAPNLPHLSSKDETQVIPVQISSVDKLFLERGCSYISDPLYPGLLSTSLRRRTLDH